jgi:hypothetical protein
MGSSNAFTTVCRPAFLKKNDTGSFFAEQTRFDGTEEKTRHSEATKKSRNGLLYASSSRQGI